MKRQTDITNESYLQTVWRRFKHHHLGVASLILLTVICLAAVLAPLIAPHDPDAIVGPFSEAPSLRFWLGTDQIGRDMLSRLLYATHGHVYNENHLPPLTDGDALIHGHTHLLEAKEITAEDGRRIKILNPGSVSIPKGGNPATYALLEDGVFTILTLDGEIVRQISL